MDASLKVRLEGDASRLKKELSDAERQLDKFGNKVKGGTTVMMDFSRVVQDAPYGIRGVANNIEQLIANFGNLQRSAGGVGGALRALAGSFLGPAGVLFAVSAALSYMTKLDMENQKLAKSAKEAGDEMKSLGDIIAGAEGSTLAEQAKVSGLIKVYSDVTNSTQQRKRALEELGQVNKSYFGDLQFESTTLDTLRKRQEEYTQAIIQQAIIKEASQELGKLGIELVKQRKTISDNRKSLQDAIGTYQDWVDSVNQSGTRAFVLDKNIAQLGQTQKASEKSFADVNQKINEYTKLIEDATISLTKLRDLQGGGGAKKVKAEKTDFSKLINAFKSDQDILESFLKENTGDNGLREFIFDPIDLIIADINVQEANARAKRIALFQEQQRQALLARNRATFEALKAQQMEFQQTLNQGLAQPLGDLIFNILDKGKFAFKDFANAAIQAIKRIVAQLVATKIIQLLASLTPFGRGVSLGKSLGNFFGSGGFNPFGRSAAPSFGGIQGGLSGEVVFVQRGSDLVGVLSRTNNRIGRVG